MLHSTGDIYISGVYIVVKIEEYVGYLGILEYRNMWDI
jgi:hypothetical protein